MTWDVSDKTRGNKKVNYQRVCPNMISKPEDRKWKIQSNYLICSENNAHVWVNLTENKQI